MQTLALQTYCTVAHHFRLCPGPLACFLPVSVGYMTQVCRREAERPFAAGARDQAGRSRIGRAGPGRGKERIAECTGVSEDEGT